MRYPTTRATPRNMRYALCDMCGFKYHIKDLTRVTDKHSRKYGLLLCKRDFPSSKAHPQDTPKIVKEVILDNIDKMRPQSEDTQYITNPNDDRLPGTPTDGHVYTDPLDGSLSLRWSAPLDQGSSPIQYYVIEYSIPQRFNYETLTSNSGTNVPYYKDTLNTTADSPLLTGGLDNIVTGDGDTITVIDIVPHLSYRVAAVNGFGQGAFSDDFFWPVDDYADIFVYGTDYWFTGDYDYIVDGNGLPIIIMNNAYYIIDTGDGDGITTGDGDYIVTQRIA